MDEVIGRVDSTHQHGRKIQIQGFSLTSSLNCLLLGQHTA